MKPDLVNRITPDEGALLKAGINPYLCSKKVSVAVKKKLKNYDVAEAFLMQFEEAINKRALNFSLESVRVDRGFPFGICFETVCLISEVDVINWPSLDDYPKKFQPATKAPEPTTKAPAIVAENITPKTKKAYEAVIAAQTLLIKLYASGQPLPERFNKQLRDDAKSILHKNGDINARALMELLQEVYPATPTSAEKIIAKALRQGLSED